MKRLSHSSLDVFDTCNYKYFLKYIKKITPFIPIRYPLVTGNAFHQLVNEMYLNRAFYKEFLIRNWKKTFLNSLETEGSAFATTKGYEKYLNYGYALIHRFYKFANDEGYLIDPIETEWSFTIQRPTYEITGKVDLIVKRPSFNFIEILDFKTSWKIPTLEEVRVNRQLTIYDWAIKNFKQLDSTKVGIFLPKRSKVILTEVTTKITKEFLVILII